MTNENNHAFQGNSLIKKAGYEHNFTPEQISELTKCANSPSYFIETYCKIISLDKGLVSFKLYDFQKRMIDAFEGNRFSINLLPRQMGKSTVVGGYLLWYGMFNREKSIGILANKAATAREILSRIQRMYEHLPLWLQIGVKEYNKGSMFLANDSKIFASSTSSSSVRGQALNLVYLDEFAFVNQQIEFWESTYPVISAGATTKVIITSTPKGLDLFHKIYKEAIEGKNDFYPVTVRWQEHPDRDENWKEITLKNIGYDQFQQEFECVAGDTVIKIRCKKTGKIEDIEIEKLFGLLKGEN